MAYYSIIKNTSVGYFFLVNNKKKKSRHHQVVAYLLATVLPLSPPDRLGDIPEVLEPLGLRARAPATESVDGVVEPLRGSVLEEPGRLREDGSERWKLGVRRTLDVGVLWEPPPSILF